MNLDLATLNALTRPGPRLPGILSWLLDEVWSKTRFDQLSAEEYLEQGEKAVHEREELLAAAGWQFYDELAAAAAGPNPLLDQLDAHTALVIFDGASLREMPRLEGLAAASGYRLVERSARYAALPSETLDFVEQRLIGQAVSPNQLPTRRELKDRRVRAFYFNDATAAQPIQPAGNEGLLLWCAFPDVTYKDSSARFTRHFAEMQAVFETAWKNTVMQVPRSRRIILTSDHGYIFFGAGFDSTRSGQVFDLLDQNRFRRFAPDQPLPNPEEQRDLQVLPDRRLAMVRGRLKNKPRGHAANRLYRHGGLSLMEMLVPWIIIQ